MIRTSRANARAARSRASRVRCDGRSTSLPEVVCIADRRFTGRYVTFHRFVRVLFLGTGTSHGVPMIGCDCAVCRSTDPRDARLRPVDLHRLRRRAAGAGGHDAGSADAGAAARHPAGRRDPVHARARRSRDGARRGAALQHAAAGARCRSMPTRRRCASCGGRSLRVRVGRPEGRRRARPAAVDDRRPVLPRPAGSRAGADPHGPWDVLGFRFGALRVSHRLQRHPGRRRWRCSAGSTASCSTRCATGRIRRTSRSTEAVEMARRDRRAPDVLHAHRARARARGDVRVAAGRHGAGARRPRASRCQ